MAKTEPMPPRAPAAPDLPPVPDPPPAPEVPPAPQGSRVRSRRFPVGIVALVAIGAANAAAWFYFRKNQPVTDEITRDRLQRWSDK